MMAREFTLFESNHHSCAARTTASEFSLFTGRLLQYSSETYPVEECMARMHEQACKAAWRDHTLGRPLVITERRSRAAKCTKIEQTNAPTNTCSPSTTCSA
jgi:hypothetical protein